ncbi:MAG: 2'-5' RNA ligase family protein [Armatimonadetes bacterium]|nr:2'-5' RNA ligase family protein [Armatimonadota bacterium]
MAQPGLARRRWVGRRMVAGSDTPPRQCCIYLRPDFSLSDSERLANFRARFDPLHGKIPPHITLVFPFALAEGDAGFAVETTRRIAERFVQFPATFGAPILSSDGYALLPLARGAGAVRDLHNALYATETFALFLNTDIAYVPHVTIGRTAPSDAKRTADITAAFTEWGATDQASVTWVIVESFGMDEVSFVEAAISLT